MTEEPVLKLPARKPEVRLCERCRRLPMEMVCEWCNKDLCESCEWEHEGECGGRD